MPVSLRLPAEVEAQIAGFGARNGLTKSAVIVRSIQEFLSRHTQPSSQQIYEEAMRVVTGETELESIDQRPHKQGVQDAIRAKHTRRSAIAASADTKPQSRSGRGT